MFNQLEFRALDVADDRALLESGLVQDAFERSRRNRNHRSVRPSDTTADETRVEAEFRFIRPVGKHSVNELETTPIQIPVGREMV
jgi:hypothetical protein